MCHHWAPMKRKIGLWVAHHPQFKEKEKWKKLMGPTSKKNIKNKTDSPIKQNGTLEITTLAG